MAERSDILVIGGGVAGLSVASVLASQAKVTVLEAEDQVGFHSSGRSATLLHYALGDPLIRKLTIASRPFFEEPPAEFADAALASTMPVLVHAREDEFADLERLAEDIAPFARLDRLDAQGLHEECPLLRTGSGHSVMGLIDRTGLKLDAHALLQGHVRRLQRSGGRLDTGARISRISAERGGWSVRTERGDVYSAPIIINAAGAWANNVARLAGVKPIGLTPMRRTIIVFDAPAGTSIDALPFTKTVGDELYFGREGGRIFASPMDEIPTDPCDAQPEEYEMALAAHRVEERTTIEVQRIHSRWAGLRTFAADRHPIVGFAADADGFFWLAGQGGAGLQTSPAIASIAEALLAHAPWPLTGVTADDLSPARFAGEAA